MVTTLLSAQDRTTATMQATPFAFPMEANYDNRSSAFFRTAPGAQLPTPDAVRLRALAASGGSVEHLQTHRLHQFRRPPVLRLREQRLLVKYGRDVTLAEAHCLLFLREVAAADVPVPELYGWRTDQRQTFLYMQYTEGATLHAHWPALSDAAKTAFGAQVRAMVAALHSIPQSLVSEVPFVGHVNGGPLLDWTIVHSATPHAGPFASAAAFHDWLAFQYGAFPRPALLARDKAHAAAVAAQRARLPDDAPVVLTHGNLRRENILVVHDPAHPAAVGGYRITAVLDWAQAGWYPAYWEDCKASWHHGKHSASPWAAKRLRLDTDIPAASPAMRELWLEMVLRRAM